MRIVLTSVNYGDFLAETLPAWKAVVPAGALRVATSPDDAESIRVAEAHGVPVVVTDAWTRVDSSCHEGAPATFNMAYGLDLALGLTGDLVAAPAPGEVVGHVNPDCVPFGRWPDESVFDDQTVYGFWRYECLQPKHLAQYQRGERPLARFPKLKNTKGAPIGYCQIFRATPGRRFGSYATAGKFDTQFTGRFPRTEMLEDVHLLHLGPVNVRENWAGRTVPAWRTA